MGIATFASQALENFQSTAAIAPSSRFLAEAMVDPLAVERARTVIELGPGTGVMTRELLRRMPFDAKLLAFEVSPRFVSYLRDNIRDPRLEVVPANAGCVVEELAKRGLDRADAVLSSLGLTLMPVDVVVDVLDGASRLIGDWGAFTQFQYVHRVRLEDGRPIYCDITRWLDERFPVVNRRMIVRNLPPAFVYDCRNRRWV